MYQPFRPFVECDPSKKTIALLISTPWGEPVRATLTPANAEGLADLLRSAAAEIRETMRPAEWVSYGGREWATDGSVVICRGTDLPKGWAGAKVLPPTALDIVRIANPETPHPGAFSPGYASILALGRAVACVPTSTGIPALVLDASGDMVAVVMPLNPNGTYNARNAIHADGAPWEGNRE